jgi:hypothetical protein
MIKELAQGNVSPPGTPPFPYFTQGQFITDINQIFDIQLEVVQCFGFLVRAVFPVQTVADLDVYCFIENLSVFFISLTRWITNIIISLGTIQYSVGQNYLIDPNCNWEASGCVPKVTDLGVYKDGVAVIDAFFGTSGGACADNLVTGACTPTHGTDLGVGGITQCVCQIFSTIFPIRPNPGAPTGPPNNCPIVDVCCPLRQLSFFFDEANKFVLQGLITLWQRWDGAYPSAFFAFWFCDETATPIPEGCGIIRPAINALTDVISLCICQYFSLLDAFLANFFPGFRCFCGGGTYPFGIFCTLGSLIFTVLTQLTELARRANDINYWQPEGYPAPDLSLTWSVRFFGPVQDALCDFVGANVCFINAIVPFCPNWLSRQFQSVFIWLFESTIRAGEFIEGFIATFAGAPCASAVQARAYGINLSCLTGSLISLFTFFFDALLADGMIACREDLCACRNNLFNNTEGFVKFTFTNAISGGVLGLDGRQPQQCVVGNQFTDAPWWFQSCCNGTAATYIFPTGGFKVCSAYNQTGDPIPECQPICQPTVPSPCRFNTPALPMCNSIIGPLPMDGIFMATLRYIRCIFQMGFGGGQVFDGAITLTSVAWQLTKPIINVVAGSIILIFDLFISPGGPFDFLFKIVDFFTSFSSIFNAPIIFPGAVDPFNTRSLVTDGRMHTRTMRSGVMAYGGIFQALHAIFTDYGVSDCSDDLRGCLNRNFNIHCEDLTCTLNMLRGKFNTETMCDTAVHAATVSPSNSSQFLVNGGNVLADRALFLECVEKRIMGERIRDCVFPKFPPAVMYTGWRYLPTLLHEINDSFQHPPDPQHLDPTFQFTDIQRVLEERKQRILDSKRFSEGLAGIVVRYDALEYKLRSGYISHLVRKVAREGRSRTPADQQHHSFGTFARVFAGSVGEVFEVSKRIPGAIQDCFNSVSAGFDLVADTYTLGLKWKTFKERWYEHITHESKEDRERRQYIRSLFQQGPVYRWFTDSGPKSRWEGPSMPLPGFVRHLHRVAKTYRESGELGFWNLYGVSERFERIRNHFYNRFLVPQWTPRQEQNVERVKGVGMKIYDTLYPGSLTRSQYERFILDDGCPIINESVDLIVSAFSYCSNVHAANANRTVHSVDHVLRNHVFGPKMAHYLETILNVTENASERIRTNAECRKRVMESYSAATSLKVRNFTFNQDHFGVERDYYPKHYEYHVWPPAKANPFAWTRPRNIKVRDPLPDHLNVSLVGVATHRRARANQDPVNFNLYTWILETVDAIFGWTLTEDLEQFFVGFQEFFLNLNSKCSDHPDVGALWYVLFVTNCDFPCNVDCRIGVGLEAALGHVLKYWGLAMLFALIFSPGLLTFMFSTTILFLVFIAITPAVAWGWSIRCAFLTPSVFFGGVSIPWIPIPVTMIFPMCLVDDVLALLDKYITTCYDFWWPAFMVVGDVCPTCPARFDFVNCSLEVGMGDGLSNLLYLGFKWGGATFCDAVASASEAIGQIFLPGLPIYVNNKCTIFQTATNTQMDRLDWCFYSTLPSLFLPAGLLIIGATFLGFVLPAIFDVIIAAFYVILASPLSVLWGGDAYLPQGDEDEKDEDEEGEGDEDEPPPPPLVKRKLREKTLFNTLTDNMASAYSSAIKYMRVDKFKQKKE